MKSKKDVLFLCQFFYPEYVSSATLPFDTAVALSEAGLSVGALCGYPKEYSLDDNVPTYEKYQDIEITRLKYLQLKRNNPIGRLINYFSFTFAVVLRFMNFRHYKSVIVYSNPPILPLIPALAQKIFGTKMIFVCYDVYPEMAYITNSLSEDSLIGRVMQRANKIIFSNMTRVVALSTEMKDYLLAHRPLLCESQVEVIPNWFDDLIIGSSSENELFKTIKDDDTFVVSYFGNLGICQDLDTILDSIRKLKNNNKIKFVFAGHGSKMGILKEAAKDEGLDNVTILDFLHGQDYLDALDMSDCFLVSLAEGLTGLCVPSKTYGYMMAGKPIIAIMGEGSDITRDLRERKAGYSFEAGQSNRVVEALLELLNSPEKNSVMGENCRGIFMDKYTRSKCTNKYVHMINAILKTETGGTELQ